jgi:alkylhydroperoxidase family enzyme
MAPRMSNPALVLPAAFEALAECVTRLSDRPDPVPDEVWDEAACHYDEVALASLLVTIGSINIWNRLNVPTRQQAGTVPLPG